LLLVIETQAGDVTAFVPDQRDLDHRRQIFLRPISFNAGIRPAINAGIPYRGWRRRAN
jgi:F-type H+-transporting ATPase subunit alpha